MVIVVAVILLIVGIVLPAASTLWRERRVAEAQDTISGLLMTTRARAMQDNFGDSGLFFYVDEAGVQRIVSIEQDAEMAASPDTREAWADVFKIRGTASPRKETTSVETPDRGYTLPAPMRVVPRYAVCDNENGKSTCHPEKLAPDGPYDLFSEVELANNDFNTLAGDQAQRHRNFFTMIYSSSGQLRVRRDVLIRDLDADADKNPGGDITGLQVADEINNYYRRDPTLGPTKPVNLAAGLSQNERESIDVVVDPKDPTIALNFPSVDGLLVYDESLFSNAGTAEQKRQFLLDAAQPFYVHRLTGAVIRGPVGETVAKAP